MVSNRMVYHDGKVVGIEANRIRVQILSQSACSACHAKGACNAADMTEKFIDTLAAPGDSFKLGDSVTVIMAETLGRTALLYGIILPLIVMVFILVLFTALGRSEAQAGLFALGGLVPYYLLLYVFRQKVEKNFSFTVEKKI